MSSTTVGLSSFFSVQKGERLKTLLLFLWLFLFICVYYVLRPIRRGMILDGLGNDKMPFVYIGTALVTGLVVWIYSRFTHLPRRTLISAIYGIFFVNLIGWWAAFQQESKLTSGLFWIWLDVFSIMGVTVFWMYANELFDTSSAKRLFGIIAAGGGLGAVLGSSITAGLVGQLGATNMLLVAAGIVALTLGIFLLMEKLNQNRTAKRLPGLELEKGAASQVSGVFSMILKNRFLLFLTFVVCLERMTPDLVQFLYHEVLKQMATGREAIAAVDANLERWRGIVELGVDLFLVSAVLRRFGTSACLSSSAGVILAGLTTFLFLPNPLVVITVFHADEACRHSWFKAAKELTYTVTSREVLYKFKPLIEMFFYRFSRGIAGLLLYLVNTVFGFGTGGILALTMALAGFWTYCAVRLSREYRRLERAALEEKLERQVAAVA